MKQHDETPPPARLEYCGSQGFLTALLQTSARKNGIAIDTLSWEFSVLGQDTSALNRCAKHTYLTWYGTATRWSGRQASGIKANSCFIYLSHAR